MTTVLHFLLLDWLGTEKPCLTFGLRGVSYFKLEVSGPGQDLHSGIFGGAVHEPMTDLFSIMSKLVDQKGRIMIPGIYDQVAKLTEEEKNRLNAVDFNLKDFQDAFGGKGTIYDNEFDTLAHRWRYPSLSLHGIEGAFYSPGSKTVIPAKVIGKFSIRSVPNMKPKEITRLVTEYIKSEFSKLDTKNTFKISCDHAGESWVADVNHFNYRAAEEAIKQVYGTQPDYTREGGSIPVTLVFQNELQKNVMLLPLGCADDGAHSINEKIDIRNYIQGIKLLGAYLYQLASKSDEIPK